MEEQKRQIGIAAVIMFAVAVVVCGLLLGVPHVEGLLGEWLGTMLGVVTTPFFMEASFAVMGLTLVFVLNYIRQKAAGDELVYLDQVVTHEEPSGVPTSQVEVKESRGSSPEDLPS